MPLSPEQFNKIALKEDLKKFATKVDHNEVMNTLDIVVKKLDNIEHAFVSNVATHDRFEKRIERLEKHLNLDPMFS